MFSGKTNGIPDGPADRAEDATRQDRAMNATTQILIRKWPTSIKIGIYCQINPALDYIVDRPYARCYQLIDVPEENVIRGDPISLPPQFRTILRPVRLVFPQKCPKPDSPGSAAFRSGAVSDALP